MPLVMRLETTAAKCDRLVKPTEKFEYDFDAADMRDLLREAATKIKQLEHVSSMLAERVGRSMYGPVE